MGWSAKLGKTIFLSVLGGTAFGQSVLPNQGIPGNGSPSTPAIGQANAAPSEEVIAVYTDPRSGREIERVRVRESVPQLGYQWKQAKETRMVPQWVTETRKTTQYQQTPVQQYQLQTRWIGRFNPFVQPTMASQYVPVTAWQSTPVVVDTPIRYQKWTPQEQTVMVRELVDNPRVVVREFERYRGSGNANPISGTPGLASNPIDPRRPLSQTSANEALAQRTAPASNALPAQGNFGLSPWTMDVRNNPQPVLAQSAVPLGSVGPAPLVNPGRWIASVHAPNQSWNGTRPLFQNTIFQASPSTNNFGGPIIPNTINTTNQFASSSMNNSNLRPTTWNPYARQSLPQVASIPGSTIYRDPTQTGLRATEIR